MIYKLSQDFHSIQGEGVHTGQQMHFVRTVGCNVGEFTPVGKLLAIGDKVMAEARAENPAHSICCSATGERFICDTEYNKTTSQLTEEEIVEQTWERHLCITGGEPFLFDLVPLCRAARAKDLDIHIETSGTLPIPADIGRQARITCSPKAKFLYTNAWMIDEFKFVISANANEATLAAIDAIVKHKHEETAVYLQPINDIDSVNKESLVCVLALLKLRPAWRLSVQLHKLLGVE